MATTVMKTGEKPAASRFIEPHVEPQKSPKHYRAFVAGVFSGIAKLSGTWGPAFREPVGQASQLANAKAPVGHPFDTVKVRLQTTQQAQFRGPLDCLVKTLQREGFAGLYKGATPPLVGWMFMDSVYALLPSPPQPSTCHQTRPVSG